MPAVRKLFLLFLLLGAIQPNVLSQGLSIETPASIAAAMAKANTFEVTPTIGFTNQPAQQYLRFSRLAAVANAEELIELAGKHDNAVVRLYAYHALKAKAVQIPASLQEQLGNDKARVQVAEGCVLSEKSVDALTRHKLTPAAQQPRFANLH